MNIHAPGLSRLLPLLALVQPLCIAQVDQGPALVPPRITQAMISSGQLDLDTIRTHGLRVFASPFNRADGFGDGPMNPADPTAPGGRPTLQNNGTFLRINGLDSQTCMECHSILSTATVPFRFGIGGVGGANNNAMAGPTAIDVNDTLGNGFAAFNGRFINPPFLFGSGGVELLAKEMTADLQAIRSQAENDPGTTFQLLTKGIDFGEIRYENGQLDLSGIEGIDGDLVVRPFGRKGEFATTRAFDLGAMAFHMGMQPVESVGQDVDPDNDGVVNEILVGEISALAIFNTNLERPRERGTDHSRRGGRLFESIGCAECHVPELVTRSRSLTYSFPEVDTDPYANVFYAVDLTRSRAGFQRAPQGGVRVPLFSDLKRHHMGTDLQESTGGTLDPWFVTPRLWGIADTAPYMHDGRALSLSEAIGMHAGEAAQARAGFLSLDLDRRNQLLEFLSTLRTPREAAEDLDVDRLNDPFTSSGNGDHFPPPAGSSAGRGHR